MSAVRAPHVTLPELLARFPSVALPLDRFLATVPVITPRYYSISSSASEFRSTAGKPPTELHITFRHLRTPVPGRRLFEGLCTSYMARRRIEENVRIAVRTSDFRLPADPRTPIVMVAGGIGITPFRAFIQERLFMKRNSGAKLGPALLLYGCRDTSDEVYHALLAEALKEGALTAFDVGYGEPMSPLHKPRLANALVLEHGKEVWNTLRLGGNVYVCGGARGFGRAVSEATKRVVELGGGMTDAESTEFLAALLVNNQYLEDLAD